MTVCQGQNPCAERRLGVFIWPGRVVVGEVGQRSFKHAGDLWPYVDVFDKPATILTVILQQHDICCPQVELIHEVLFVLGCVAQSRQTEAPEFELDRQGLCGEGSTAKATTGGIEVKEKTEDSCESMRRREGIVDITVEEKEFDEINRRPQTEVVNGDPCSNSLENRNGEVLDRRHGMLAWSGWESAGLVTAGGRGREPAAET